MNTIFNTLTEAIKFAGNCEICGIQRSVDCIGYNSLKGEHVLDVSGTSYNKIYIVISASGDRIEFKDATVGKNKKTLLTNSGYTFHLRSKCWSGNQWKCWSGNQWNNIPHKVSEFNVKIDFDKLKPSLVNLRGVSYTKDEFILKWHKKLTVMSYVDKNEKLTKELSKKVDKDFSAFEKYLDYMKNNPNMLRILM